MKCRLGLCRLGILTCGFAVCRLACLSVFVFVVFLDVDSERVMNFHPVFPFLLLDCSVLVRVLHQQFFQRKVDRLTPVAGRHAGGIGPKTHRSRDFPSALFRADHPVKSVREDHPV